MTTDKNVALKIIIPTPSIKFPQGRVPKAIPKLAKRFGTKFIIAEAVPTFSFALFKRTSIPKGRATVPITLKGKKQIKNDHAEKCPGNKTASPLTIATQKQICISRLLEKCFLSCM